MNSWFKGRMQSFKYALHGVRLMLHQPNFRIHIVIFTCVICLAYFLQVSLTDWALLIIVSGLVFVAEGINTAIETLTDLVTLEKNKRAGIAKDIAAGAVLLAAVIAVTAGLIIFSKYLL